jgi:hypothetical protein
MAITGEHDAAERAFRELLPEAGLPQPDEVEYRDESVVFLWHETKLAVVVELGGTGAVDVSESAGGDLSRGAGGRKITGGRVAATARVNAEAEAEP